MIRIGHGDDVHKLTEGRDLIIGGVNIPHTLGLLGHSDADVLLHAISDSLLGALALGDIGRHFPDTDPQYVGISSMRLLARVMEMVRERAYGVVNADVTIVAQRPKLSPYMDTMRANVAEALGVARERVNIKATTTEGLGFEGEGMGISAQAVVLLRQDSFI